MIKYILSILFVALFVVSTPVFAMSDVELSTIDASVAEMTITVNGSTVRVTGANGCVLSIYNVAGVRVKTVKIDSADKLYDLDLPKGCYILQVGKTVRKISVR